ncbi:MAG: hypothetical protein AAGI92_09225 [Pseudomonadota bacterium]
MYDFSFLTCFSIVARTWPFLLLRAAVFITFGLIFCILVASCALIAHQLGPQYTPIADPWMAAGFGAVAGMGLGKAVLVLLREYTLYLVTAGHISTMSDMLRDKLVPSGFAQVSNGAAVVKENFAESSALFVLDQLIKGALKSMDEAFRKVGAVIPVLAPVFALLGAVLTTAITYIDEMILAHIMRTKSGNSWHTAADALVIYAQNWKTMLKNAAWLTAAMLLISAGVAGFGYLIAPTVPDVSFIDGDIQTGARVIFAFALLIVFHLIFLEPFAVCAMLQAYVKASDGQKPDPHMEDRLATMSESFQKLRGGKEDGWSSLFKPA